MTKRKDERRELLQEDEIHSFMERVARASLQNSTRTILLTVGGLALLAAIFFGIEQQESSQKAQAAELYKTEKILNTGVNDPNSELKLASEKEKVEKSDKQLSESLAKLSGAAKQQAQVHKIGLLIAQGKQSDAALMYGDLAQNGQGLQMLGVVGEAEVLVAQGKYEEARNKYKELRGLDDFTAYKVAEIYKLENNMAAAKEELTKLVDRYKDKESDDQSPIYQKAQTMLEELSKETPKQGA